MKQIAFIKNSISDAITSSFSSVEDVKLMLGDSEDVSAGIIYNFLNRQEYLQDIFNALNSKTQNLTLISGFQGTGKTELIKSIICSLDKTVLRFYYECSTITNLDDIMVSLYGYLYKFLNKESGSPRLSKMSGVQSVDEKLINCLRNLKRPLFIAIDGFENLLQDNFKIADEELAHFLNFILSLPNIKLVLAGKRVPASGLEINKEKTTHIRLSGLDEDESIKLLRDNNISGSDQTLYQIYQITRGYPESILWFVNAVKNMGLNPFDLVKDYLTRRESFEEYIARIIYHGTPNNYRKIMWLLSVIRHPINHETIGKLQIAQDFEKTIDILKERMILVQNNESYYIKEFVKQIIYASIPANDKLKIHKYFHELYTAQIPIKLAERILAVSRKSLYSEQYYHYICLSRLEKETGTTGKKPTSLVQDISFLPSNMIEAMYWTEKSNNNEQSTQNKIEKTDEYTIPDDAEKFSPAIDISATLSEIEIDLDTKIELTEEEKSLLGDLSDESSIITDDLKTENKSEPALNITYRQKPEEIKLKSPEQIRDDLVNKAQVLEKNQRLDLALDNYKEAYLVSKNLRDYPSIASISNSIGQIMHLLHNYDDALTYLNTSLETFSRLKDAKNANAVLLNIANIYNDTYKQDAALVNYRKIIESNPSQVADNTLIEALSGIGDIYDYRGDIDKALKYYLNALSKAENSNYTELKSRLYFKIGLLYDDFNNREKAVEYYKKNIQTDDSERNPYLAASYANIAAINEEIGNNDVAASYYIRSLKIDKNTDNFEGQYKTLSRLANIYLEIGDKDKARLYFHQELQAAKKTEDPYWIAAGYLDIGDFFIFEKQYDRAIKSFIRARKTIGNAISTDTKEKIDRRFRQVISQIGETKFHEILDKLKKKNE